MKNLDLSKSRVQVALKVLKVLDLIENDDTIVEMWNPEIGVYRVQSCDCTCCTGRNKDEYGGLF